MDIVKLDSHYGQGSRNRPQITLGVIEPCDKVVENVDVDYVIVRLFSTSIR